MSEPRRVLLAGATGLIGSRGDGAGDRPAVAAADRADPARGADAARRADGDARRRSAGLARGGRRDRARGGDLRARHDHARRRAARRRSARSITTSCCRSPRRRKRGRGGQLRARLLGRRRCRTARRSTCGSRARSRPRVTKLRFRRLDILRPGLLRGSRGGDRAAAERLGDPRQPADRPAAARRQAAVPLDRRAHRRRGGDPVRAREGARALVHDNDAIRRAARRLEGHA